MRKYKAVIALVTIAALSTFVGYALGQTQETLVREQAQEKRQDVGLLAAVVDTLVEMDELSGNSYGYDEVLRKAVVYIEANYNNTFAQVFDADLTALTGLSSGVGGGRKHNPLVYPEFVEAVRNNEHGSLTYWYETAQAGGRYIHMYYRWVPTDATHTSRYLIAVGISKYTVQERIDPRVTYGTVAALVVAAAYILLYAYREIRLGYIAEERGARTWQGKGDGGD